MSNQTELTDYQPELITKNILKIIELNQNQTRTEKIISKRESTCSTAESPRDMLSFQGEPEEPREQDHCLCGR